VRGQSGVPVFLKSVSQLKDFDLDFTFCLVLEDLGVWLAGAVFGLVPVLGVGSRLVAGSQQRAVLLYVAGSAATPGRGEADVVCHGRVVCWLVG
jgi:hypothetical protein